MTVADFHFIRPYWLFALLPWLVVLAARARRELQQGNWSNVCDEALLPYILQRKTVNRSRVSLTAGALASLLTIFALAGPTWERLPSPVFRNESALVIALDLSRSMNASDIKPSRLVRARYKIADILKQRKDGQTALLVYAGDAFTVTPLTDDNDTIASQLSALTSAIMPSQGSNASLALERALDLLKQAGLQQGHILLVTDGVAYDATESAVKLLGNYRLSVLGVGTTAGAPIRAPEGGFVKDSQGNIVVPKLVQDDLSKLAARGHGIYQTISANDKDIETLLAYFDSGIEQKSAEGSPMQLQQWADKGPWLLLAVLPLAALSFRKGLLGFMLFCILPFPQTGYALDWQDLWQTRDQQAYKAFKNNQYDKAAKLFENQAWKAAAQYKADLKDLSELKTPKTATGFYNQGNVLAKSGHFEEAIKSYEKALNIDPSLEDARYNKEIVQKELEKQQQKQENDRQQAGQNSDQDKQQDSSKNAGEQQPKEREQSLQEQKPNEKTQADQQRQTPENSEARQSAADQQAQQTQEPQDQQQQNSEQQDAAEKAAQRVEESQEHNDEPKDADQPIPTDTDRPQAETQQANEQWLKRIPDDPAGLLRRKFLYQYGQRGRQSETREDW
ncbi:MAG: VWA domain-containing protein [Gammaproteobacteria bacterium]